MLYIGKSAVNECSQRFGHDLTLRSVVSPATWQFIGARGHFKKTTQAPVMNIFVDFISERTYRTRRFPHLKAPKLSLRHSSDLVTGDLCNKCLV